MNEATCYEFEMKGHLTLYGAYPFGIQARLAELAEQMESEQPGLEVLFISSRPEEDPPAYSRCEECGDCSACHLTGGPCKACGRDE